MSALSMPELHEIDHMEGNGKVVKVIESVAARWERVAIRLEFNHHIVERIKRDSHHQSIPSCQTMFTEWLDGNGRQPVNWQTLITALQEADFSELANDLQVVLMPSSS